ncbi:phosphatidylinositol-specific phospholipase C domain-containing protein [Mycoplasma procyoni]|uniref:phosphatidylinositol-specific phospholipase C domain-containing protein n=1 Tax=Mycoplasma procyoni TaxID=568784 RepID=UPI00197C504B|nr:phosphatidylinositol-specific phospholipase C domain-containing protein [Mycoplasma procyoni]MBN3534579.1 phosphatidylinositol-specific phospholipase C domain-containing protein [Mycoplasma procyoni]
MENKTNKKKKAIIILSSLAASVIVASGVGIGLLFGLKKTPTQQPKPDPKPVLKEANLVNFSEKNIDDKYADLELEFASLPQEIDIDRIVLKLNSDTELTKPTKINRNKNQLEITLSNLQPNTEYKISDLWINNIKSKMEIANPTFKTKQKVLTVENVVFKNISEDSMDAVVYLRNGELLEKGKILNFRFASEDGHVVSSEDFYDFSTQKNEFHLHFFKKFKPNTTYIMHANYDFDSVYSSNQEFNFRTKEIKKFNVLEASLKELEPTVMRFSFFTKNKELLTSSTKFKIQLQKDDQIIEKEMKSYSFNGDNLEFKISDLEESSNYKFIALERDDFVAFRQTIDFSTSKKFYTIKSSYFIETDGDSTKFYFKVYPDLTSIDSLSFDLNGQKKEFKNVAKTNDYFNLVLENLQPKTEYVLSNFTINQKELKTENEIKFQTATPDAKINSFQISQSDYTSIIANIDFLNPESLRKNQSIKFKLQKDSGETKEISFIWEENKKLFLFNNLEENTYYRLIEATHRNKSLLLDNANIRFKTNDRNAPKQSLKSIRIQNEKYTSAQAVLSFASASLLQNKPIKIYLSDYTGIQKELIFNNYTISGNDVVFNLENLESDRNYIINYVLIDTNAIVPETGYPSFSTKRRPEVSNLSIANITKSNASVNLAINNVDPVVENSLKIKVKLDNNQAFEKTFSNISSQTKFDIELNNLVAETNYSITEISINDIVQNIDFINTKSFKTADDIKVQNISAKDIKDNAATLVFAFANADNSYKNQSFSFDLSDGKKIQKTSVNIENSLYEVHLDNLSPHTKYTISNVLLNGKTIEVLDKDFEFTTLEEAKVDAVGINGVYETSANLSISFSNFLLIQPNQTILVEFSNNKTVTLNTSNLSAGSINVNLESLNPNTEYRLNSIKINNKVVENLVEYPVFTTSKTRARISNATFSNISQNSARVVLNVENANWFESKQGNLVLHFSYQENNTSHVLNQNIAISSLTNNQFSFDLNSLISNTTYKLIAARYENEELLVFNQIHSFKTRELIDLSSFSVSEITKNSALLNLNFINSKDIETEKSITVELNGNTQKTFSNFTKNGNRISLLLDNLATETNYRITKIQYDNKDIKKSISVADFKTLEDTKVTSLNQTSIGPNFAHIELNLINAQDYTNTNSIVATFSNGYAKTLNDYVIQNNKIVLDLQNLTQNTNYSLESLVINGKQIAKKGSSFAFTTTLSPASVSNLSFSETSALTTKVAAVLENKDWINTNEKIVVALVKDNQEIRREITGYRIENNTISFILDNLESNSIYEISKIIHKGIELEIKEVNRNFKTESDLYISSATASEITYNSAKFRLNLRNLKDLSTTNRKISVLLNDDSVHEDVAYEIIDNNTIEFKLIDLSPNTEYKISGITHLNQVFQVANNTVFNTFRTLETPKSVELNSINITNVQSNSATLEISFKNQELINENTPFVFEFNNNITKEVTNYNKNYANNFVFNINDLSPKTTYTIRKIKYANKEVIIPSNLQEKSFTTVANRPGIDSIQVSNTSSDTGTVASFNLHLIDDHAYSSSKRIKLKIKTVDTGEYKDIQVKFDGSYLNSDKYISTTTYSLFANRTYEIYGAFYGYQDYDEVAIDFPTGIRFSTQKTQNQETGNNVVVQPEPEKPKPKPEPEKPKPNYNYDQPVNNNDYISNGSTTGLNNWDWMSSLNDNKLISDISIPGTHDSGMFSGRGWTYFFGQLWAKTQSKSWEYQLKQGIRFFDVRIEENLNIIHGSAKSLTSLPEMLKEFERFLKQHPHEFILIRLKSENYGGGRNENYRRKVEEALKKHYDMLYKTADNRSGGWPKVKDVRGKLIVFNDLHSDISQDTTYGPLYYRNQNNYTFWIQDRFQNVSQAEKLGSIKNHFKDSNNTDLSGIMFINFTSYTQGIYSVWDVASGINEPVTKHIRENKDLKKLGIVVSDFPGDALVQEIINTNRR